MKTQDLRMLERRLKKVRVIYTDIDGTLVGPGGSLFASADGTLTLRTARAVFKAVRLGIDVFMVSGRSSHGLRTVAQVLGFRNYAAELGSEIIYDLGEKVISNIHGFDLGKGEKPIDWIRNSGALDLIFGEFPHKIRYYTPFSDSCHNTALLIGNVEVTKANQILNEHCHRVLRLVDNGKVPPVPDFSHPHCYHLLAASAGKKLAVRKDKEIRRLDKKHLVGIGESIEDLEIASEVGAYFVVRNGAEEDTRVMKAVSEQEGIFLTDSRMGLGWAEVIDILEDLGKM